MSTPGFRSFSPALQRFLLATIINMIGSGALFGFVLIYFHEVRHIPLGQAGLAVGALSLTVALCTPFAGSLSDHFGAKRVLIAGCLLSIVAGGLYAVVTSFAMAVGVSMLLGFANALWFPAQSALMSLIVTPEERPALSAFHRAALNLGAALGGVAGGVLVRAGDLASFRWLFALNVLSYMVFLAMLRGLPDGKVEHTAPRRDRPGFEVVFRDTFFMRLIVTDVSIALGFGFLFGFMPAYASKLGVGKATIGLMFMFGAVTVVVTQIPTLRWVSGRRRMRSLALMNAWFVVAFALMVATPYLTLGLAVAAIAVGQMLGGFGESIMGAVRQPLTSDLAPPAVVGRYFGLASMVFQGGMGLANALGGVVMQHSMKLVWLVPLAVSVAGVLGSLALGRRVPTHVAISP